MGMPATLTAPIHAAAFVDGHHLAEPDPVDGHLLLDERVQKDLKLSTKQIGRIKEVSQGVDVKNEAKKKQIEELRKQIEELRVRMGELAGDVNTASMQIEDERSVTLGKAALDIVSEKAVTRLRQIQRQKRSLDNVLADAKVQRMLKVDDEQVKKIETILKTESMRRNVRISSDGMFWEVHALHWSGRTAQWDERALQKLFDILTPAQQRTMTEWLGEPHEGTSWHALRTKAK
jgi:hypothetical protein